MISDRPLFYFRLQRSSRAIRIEQGQTLKGLLKKSSSPCGFRYFFAKPCTIQHGTVWQARNKISAHEPVSV